jgi:DNA (cytosine-5)-methyltransferase 1
VNVALRAISLFAGGGGLDLGLERAGIARTICRVERDLYPAAILAARARDGSLCDAPVWSDVSTFDGRPWRGVVDLIHGGFPCQDISVAGLGAGIIEGERSGLWREFARIVREVGPRFVFIENVAALVVRGLDVVLGDLAAMGFDAEWGVFRASDAGAPHQRERIFILAHALRGGRGGEQGGAVAGSDGAASGGAGRLPVPAGRGAAVAGPASGGLGEHRRPRRRGRHADERLTGVALGADGARGLADAERDALRLLAERDQLEGRGERAAVGGDAVAGYDRGEALADGLGLGLEGQHVAGPAQGAALGSGGGAVADALRTGLERAQLHARPGRERSGAPRAAGASAPWPPGPGDAAGWREYLRRWPGLEPAVRRGAPGLAHRVDRLRACGNLVVPDQSVLAWCALAERLFGG